MRNNGRRFAEIIHTQNVILTGFVRTNHQPAAQLIFYQGLHDAESEMIVLNGTGVKAAAVDNEAVAASLRTVMNQAMDAFDGSRSREGEALKKILQANCTKILETVDALVPRIPQIHAQLQAKLTERLEAALSEALSKAGSLTKEEVTERIRQEVTLYALRMDVAEEVNRLRTHVAEVRRVLAEGRKKELIVLHTYGSHFNYRERYPRREARFLPDDATEAKPKNRPQLVNAYDNTIRATDRLLHSVIAELAKTGAVSALLYTSDHGENIFDDSRRLFLHASPVPSYYELHVPMLVWTSAAYRQAWPQEAASLAANRTKPVATSASVFHTLLGLAGIATPLRDDALSVASRRYAPRPLIYLNDHNRAVPLHKILRSEKDFEMFGKKGILLSSN